jgi:hypothetical protein
MTKPKPKAEVSANDNTQVLDIVLKTAALGLFGYTLNKIYNQKSGSLKESAKPSKTNENKQTELGKMRKEVGTLLPEADTEKTTAVIEEESQQNREKFQAGNLRKEAEDNEKPAPADKSPKIWPSYEESILDGLKRKLGIKKKTPGTRG